ncbi:MAG: 50S ribosomal protein L18 [Candidatus Doudnabacteria bacterium]|nr:50S ribosomal protein L18 [Candidatus Doudnabacteria bacterium]
MSDNRTQSIHVRRNRRRVRVRSRVSGTAERPRLSVFRSSKHIYAQIVDDVTGKTLAQASSSTSKVAGKKTDKSVSVGAEVAKKAKTAGVTKVVFDRGGYKYHGRVKALADAAREAGLEF